MSKRRVLLVTPYKARDLEGCALVAYHLERRYGHEVVLTNGYGIERKLRELTPDLLVLDHLAWTFKIDQAQQARRYGMKVAILPTEGYFQKKVDAAMVAGCLMKAEGLADEFCSWGYFQREAILEHGLLPEDRISVIGCPRFDLYREPYLRLGVPRDEFLRDHGFADPSRPLVLWATNTPYHGRAEKDIVGRYVQRANWTEEQVLRFLEDQTNQFRIHARIVRDLALRHPEWNILIKIHPAEWVDHYVAMEAELENVRLGYDRPILDYLRHCDLLLQRNCTTATEAWILGKPVLDLEIGEYHEDVDSEHKHGSHVLHHEAEVEPTAAAYLAGAPIPAAQRAIRDSFLHRFYDRVDGRASERCAARLAELISAPRFTDADSARARAAARADQEAWQSRQDGRLVNRAKDLLGIDRRTSLRFWRRLRRKRGGEAEITPEMTAELFEQYERLEASA